MHICGARGRSELQSTMAVVAEDGMAELSHSDDDLGFEDDEFGSGECVGWVVSEATPR